jgi:hypothetical protein
MQFINSSVRLFIFLNLICVSLFLFLFRFMKHCLSRSVSKRAGAKLLQFGPANLDPPLAMGLRCLQMYLDFWMGLIRGLKHGRAYQGKRSGMSCKGERVVIRKVGSQHISAYRNPYCWIFHICIPHFFKLNKINTLVTHRSYSTPKCTPSNG